MDYTAFWNVAPSASLFLLVLGMAGFTLMNFGRARLLAAQPARRTESRSDEMPETIAA